jgi:hypothetical protein
MIILSKLTISINLDLLILFYNFLKSNLLIITLVIISFISLMAGRSTDKILKGLQGTASAAVITRGAIDAYKA